MRHTNDHRAPRAVTVAHTLRALACLLPLLAPAARASTSADDVVVTAANGDVRITFSGSARAAKPGLALELPAAVHTGRDGSIDLRQGDTTLGIGPDTQLEFPAPSGKAIERVVQPIGNAFYDVGPQGNRRLRVETPYLVAVIKGTQFNVAVTSTGSSISLYEGRLEVLAPDGGAPTVELNAGEIAVRNAGEPLIRVLRMKDAGTPAAGAANGAGDGATSGLKPVDGPHPVPHAPATPTPLDDEVDVIIDVATSGGNAAVDTTIAIGNEGDLLSAEAGVSAGANLASGTVDAGVDAGLDLGPSSVDAGADAALDLGAGTLDAGIDATAAGIDAGLDVGIDLTGSDAGVQIDLGVLDAGLGIDLGLGDVTGGSTDAPSSTEESGGLLEGVLRRLPRL